MSFYTTTNLFTTGMKSFPVSKVKPETPILCYQEGDIITSHIGIEEIPPSPVIRLTFGNGTYLDCTDSTVLLTSSKDWKPVSAISHNFIPIFSIYGIDYQIAQVSSLGIFPTFHIHSGLPYLLYNGIIGR